MENTDVPRSKDYRHTWRVRRTRDVEVWAKPSFRPPCKHCQGDGLRIKATYFRTVKHTRQGNQVLTLHLQAPKYHCISCKRYFRHAFTGIRPRYRASEAYRLEVFETHDGGVTERKLPLTHQISPATRALVSAPYQPEAL